jgi:hypothetical protein
MAASTRIWLTVSTTVALLLVLASSSYATDATYEPFVTDFPQGSPSATDAAYVPFVTDFPTTAQSKSAAPSGVGGFDWGTAGAIGVGVLGLAALAGLILLRRSRRVAVAS